MESYNDVWYSEEPLDLSIKVETRQKKSQHSNDSPLCLIKSCACINAVSEKENDSGTSNPEDASKWKESAEFSANVIPGENTKEVWSTIHKGYSKTSLTPSLCKRDSLPKVNNSRSPIQRESPSLTCSSLPQTNFHRESVSPSNSSGSQIPPVSTYQTSRNIKFDMRQSIMSAIEREYSDVHFERESSPREASYYCSSSTSPRGIGRREYPSSFNDGGMAKIYRPSSREDEKTTFFCMDTGKYYESDSIRQYGVSRSNSNHVSSPVDKGHISQIAESLNEGSLRSEKGEHPNDHIQYSSHSAVYSERNVGSYSHIDPQPSEGQLLSNSVNTAKQDEFHPKQTETVLWSPATGVCYKQYQASLKRQFPSVMLEFDANDCNDCTPTEAKKICDKNGCQNWLLDESNKTQQERHEKTQNSEKESSEWMSKFESVQSSASTKTTRGFIRASSPFIMTMANMPSVWPSETIHMEKKENCVVTGSNDELDEKQIDSENPLEQTTRKMCALDYLISKVLVERIDVPFKACNTEINRIYRGECKGRLRLVDLIELQVEASLKA